MSLNYNMEWLTNNIKNEIEALRFFQIFNIIPLSKVCSNGHSMKIKQLGKRLLWECRKKPCIKRQFPVRKETWLEGYTLPLRQIIKFIYCWSEELTMIKFCEEELNISKPSCVDFNNYLREVCASTLLNQPRSIGGEDKTVEIDYTYFTKRKNDEGKLVPCQWVFGGICRETEEVFLCTVPDTTEDIIIQCIKNNIQPGTTIISDCQPSYKNIESIKGYNYKHLMVNSSEDIVDSALNANLQSIENIWFILNERNKKHCGMYRKMLDSYLSEFVWRRRYANKDLFINMLKDIASCHSPKVLLSPPVSKESNSLKEKGIKRKKSKNGASLKMQERENCQERDSLQILEDKKCNGNDNECSIPNSSQSHGIFSGNIASHAVDDRLRPSSNDELMRDQGCVSVSEFDLFGESVSKRLNKMPRNGALQLQLKIEQLVTNFRQQMSFITPHKSFEAPSLCDENFIDIKMEIKEELND